jgi:hypothetical protein
MARTQKTKDKRQKTKDKRQKTKDKSFIILKKLLDQLHNKASQ